MLHWQAEAVRQSLLLRLRLGLQQSAKMGRRTKQLLW
jgi:hypothetical protein